MRTPATNYFVKSKRLLSSLLPLAVIAITLCGCGSHDETEKTSARSFADYGDLPGLLNTHHQGLQDELARLKSERATPRLLMSTTMISIKHPDGSRQAPTGQGNAADVLAEVFRGKQVGLIDKIVGQSYPSQRFEFDPVSLQRVIGIRRQHESQREQVRAALASGKCDFHLQHIRGPGADTSFVEAARVYQRLEAYLAAEYLASGKTEQAVISLTFMFRMIQYLAREKRVVPRLSAVQMRLEALGVVEEIARHERASRKTLVDLSQLIGQQLAAWPPDEEAWIGDRALGMHTYEMIRDGHLLSLLTKEEQRDFQQEGTLEELNHAVAKNIDTDEFYYLNTMRDVIEGCKLPFYQRKKIFRDIRQHLHDSRTKTDFPIIAARILLPAIEKGHKMQARDRATCQAWALALAEAVNHTAPPYKVSPLTGQPYRVERQQTRIVVRGIEKDSADRPVIVPIKQ